LENKIAHHQDHLKVTYIHVAEISRLANVLEELLEIVDCSLVDLILLDALQAA
jgi:hypothetical protein